MHVVMHIMKVHFFFFDEKDLKKEREKSDIRQLELQLSVY